ncbi:MAG: TRAP transporter small permease subunit [Lachnospiraceae bacterium]
MKYLLKVNKIIVKLEQVILGGSIIAMATILILNVLGRLFFRVGITAAEELGQNLLVFVTFIGLSYCATTGKHINMLALFDIMPSKMKKATALLISGVTSCTMLTLAAIAFQYALLVKEIGKVTVTLQIPVYLIILVVFFGFLFAGIQYLLVFIENIKKKEIYLGLDSSYSLEVKEEQ